MSSHPGTEQTVQERVFRIEAIIDPPSEPGPHCLFVLLDSCSKGLQFGKVAAFYLGQSGIELLSCAGAHHPHKLLDQIRGQFDLWVDLAQCGHGLLFLSTPLFGATKDQKGSLSWSSQRRSLG